MEEMNALQDLYESVELLAIALEEDERELFAGVTASDYLRDVLTVQIDAAFEEERDAVLRLFDKMDPNNASRMRGHIGSGESL